MVNPGVHILRRDDDSTLVWEKWLMPSFQEKSLSDDYYQTVPETDTGGNVENTKALERTRVKDLGKLAP